MECFKPCVFSIFVKG